MSELLKIEQNADITEYINLYSNYFPFDQDFNWDKNALYNVSDPVNPQDLKDLIIPSTKPSYQEIKSVLQNDLPLLVCSMSIMANRINIRNISSNYKSYIILKPEEEVLLFTGLEQLKNINNSETESSISDLINQVQESIIMSNIGLVRKIAFKYSSCDNSISRELDDIVQHGFKGVIGACKNFDPSRGYKFSSYAIKYIEGEIKNYIAKYSDLVTFSDSMKLSMNRYFSNKRILSNKLGRVPSFEECYTYCNEKDIKLPSKDKLERAIILTSVIDLDETNFGNEDNIGNKNKYLFNKNLPLQEYIEHKDITEQLKRLVEESNLTDNEKIIVELRFGFVPGTGKNNPVWTLNETSKVLNVTRQRVQQLEIRITEKLRKTMLKNGYPSIDSF